MNDSKIYLHLLHREFQAKNNRNANYSLRAFARDIGISPATLSLVFRGRKGLSTASANRIALKLDLSQSETELLVNSVEATHARSKAKRHLAAGQLASLVLKANSSRKYKSVELATANKWHHFAILELLELRSGDANWISKKLGINFVVVKQALKQLLVLNWIRETPAGYEATHAESETSFDISSKDIRGLHNDFLEKAKLALFLADVKQREFLNMTLAFQLKDMVQAKAAIRQFQSSFNKQFCNGSSQKNSLYQLSIQFFRLDKKDVSHD